MAQVRLDRALLDIVKVRLRKERRARCENERKGRFGFAWALGAQGGRLTFQPIESTALCTPRDSVGSVGSPIAAQPTYTPSVAASKRCSKARGSRLAVGHPSCLLPRWNPATTAPTRRCGPTDSTTRAMPEAVAMREATCVTWMTRHRSCVISSPRADGR